LQQLTGAGIPLKLAMEILGYDLTDEQWDALEPDVPEPIAPVVVETQPALPPPAEVIEPVDVEEAPTMRSLSAAELKELQIWQRKAIKALKSGLSANCEFTVECVDPVTAFGIYAALSSCHTIDEIKAVFDRQRGADDDPWLAAANKLSAALEALA
jgi:hypothetical protein